MAKGKSYNVGFVFGAQKSSSFAKTISGVNSDLGGIGDKVGKVLKGVAGFAGAYVGLSAIKSFAGECSELATAALEAEAKLGQVMRNTMDATDAQVQQVIALAQAQERIGVIQADIQVAGMQELGTYVEEVESLETLMPVMNDMLAQQYGLNASQGDAVTIATMMGKVLNGQVSGLSRLGYSFTEAQERVLKYGTEAQKAATLAEVISESVGGMNAALADTDIGAIQQRNNALSSLKETVGRGLIPLQARFARMVTASVPQMTRWAEKGVVLLTKGVDFLSIKGVAVLRFTQRRIGWIRNVATSTFAAIQGKVVEIRPHIAKFTGLVTEVGGAIGRHLKGAFEGAKPIIEWVFIEGLPAVVVAGGAVLGTVTDIYRFITGNWSYIAPLVYGIVGAFGAYKAIVLGVAVAQKAFTAVMAVGKGVVLAYKAAVAAKAFVMAMAEGSTIAATVAQLAFNAVLKANPIGLVVAAIGVLIAVGVALWKNWDVIKEKAFGLWEGIQTAFGGVGEWFGGLWEGVKQGFKGFVNFIIGGLNRIPEGINGLSMKIPYWVPLVGGNELGFSLPTIQPFATGGIVTKPMLGMVGEAGQSEAIIPLPTLFKQLREMMGGGGGVNITYAPQTIIQGNADQDVIERANAATFQQFKQWAEQYERERRRLNPNPV